MLTLIGFDIKNTWTRVFWYCLAIAIATGLTVYFWSGDFAGFFNDENFYWITIFQFGSLGIAGAVCCICVLMTFIVQSQWFFQNLLADEGHFMNMLPIGKIKLFLSKTITAFVWNLVVVGFSVGCVMLFLKFDNRFDQINDIITDLMNGEGTSVHLVHLFVEFGLMVVLQSTSLCVLSYTSLCVGQFVNIGKNLLVLIGFVGLGLAELVMTGVLAYLMGVFDFSSLTSIPGIMSYFGSFCIKMSIISFIEIIFMIALGTYLLSSRLNID
jgi:hypothetical protein